VFILVVVAYVSLEVEYVKRDMSAGRVTKIPAGRTDEESYLELREEEILIFFKVSISDLGHVQIPFTEIRWYSDQGKTLKSRLFVVLMVRLHANVEVLR
jgi:hypothetical protein